MIGRSNGEIGDTAWIHRPRARTCSAACGTRTYAHPLIGAFTLDRQVLRLPEDYQFLMVLTTPPDTAASKPPQARLVPRLSLGVLRQPTTRRKTPDRTLANELCARPWASLDPSEREDESTRLVCPASATRRHPTARTPIRVCAEPRKVAGDCFRLLSGAGVHGASATSARPLRAQLRRRPRSLGPQRIATRLPLIEA